MAADIVVSTGDLGQKQYDVIGTVIVGVAQNKFDLDTTIGAYSALQAAALAVGGDAVVFARFLLRPAIGKTCMGTTHATVVVGYGTAVRVRP